MYNIDVHIEYNVRNKSKCDVISLHYIKLYLQSQSPDAFDYDSYFVPRDVSNMTFHSQGADGHADLDDVTIPEPDYGLTGRFGQTYASCSHNNTTYFA